MHYSITVSILELFTSSVFICLYNFSSPASIFFGFYLCILDRLLHYLHCHSFTWIILKIHLSSSLCIALYPNYIFS
ncbi:hypothetical protein F5051DRAFT_15096 [Lentinula edodes]|nr:hypothetical protein F5051DRAFT_15096 [Lentinula edodes]